MVGPADRAMRAAMQTPLSDTPTRHDQHGRYPRAETVEDFRHNLEAIQARIDVVAAARIAAIRHRGRQRCTGHRCRQQATHGQHRHQPGHPVEHNPRL